MRAILPISIVLTLLLAGSFWIGQPSEAAVPFEAKVRLYSDGQVVGEWLAVGSGRVEGETFVFPVRKGAREFEVRISGTFSLEQQP